MASREQQANEGEKTRRTSVVPGVNEGEATTKSVRQQKTREQYSMIELFNVRNYHENNREQTARIASRPAIHTYALDLGADGTGVCP
jgi:hypothetical protein